ncbi:MAG: hypothetical protein COU69_04585 [Candidatus Pacebacteria bacterium CG10_big_fil_rev_8_21_14_0_10_56_10]|nr:MAG: hypothetical protein COU69_04585 [Candidatus Pacebacteria bacterium CG10_big_fil_rev_8_21_14_0_10_56_10]
MRLLQVCSYLYPAMAYGGPAKVVYDLSRDLARRHHLTIYTTDVWDERRRIRPGERLASATGFEVEYFANWWNRPAFRWRLFTGWGMVGRFIHRHRAFALVHVHDVYILPQLVLVLAALLLEKPVVVSAHGVLDPVRSRRRSWLKAGLFRLVAQPLLRQVNCLVATSAQEAADLRRLGFDRVAIVANGVAPPTARPSRRFGRLFRPSRRGRDLKVVYIGKLHPQKGLPELVSALAQLERPVTLILAGPDDGAQPRLENLINRYRLTNVKLVGTVNESEKQELLTGCDVFVYPSLAEGFSISILEALQAGRPVLITNGCNFPQVAKAGAGIIVSTRRLAPRLAAALDYLARHPRRRRAMGKRARQLFNRHYTISTMAESLEELYRRQLPF